MGIPGGNRIPGIIGGIPGGIPRGGGPEGIRGGPDFRSCELNSCFIWRTFPPPDEMTGGGFERETPPSSDFAGDGPVPETGRKIPRVRWI